MNYLAHCYFAQPNSHSIVGNLLGDFCKGLDESKLDTKLQYALQNHRAVDKFTDQHPAVLQAKQCFSARRRRFAPIAVDVLFD